MTESRSRSFGPILLGLAAAAYFLAGATLIVEWSDEGQILYPSWRVSAGAIPYRDFEHIYGPSLFFLNGGLFRLFGADLLVIRISLVLLKAVLAVLVYLAARRVSSRAFALGAYAFFVAMWGASWWVFKTPYANHYAVVLNLAGFLLLLSLPGPVLGSALAGLSFGLAVTFKQTTGAFALIAFLWWVLFTRTPAMLSSKDSAGNVSAFDFVARVARLSLLLASLIFVLSYVGASVDLWTYLVLLMPTLVTTLLLACRELRLPPSPADHQRSLRLLASCSTAMAVPLLSYAALYQRLGAFRSLLYNTISGLPQTVDWFVPFSHPSRHTAYTVLVLVSAFATTRLRAPRQVAGERRLVVVYRLVLGTCVLASAALLWELIRPARAGELPDSFFASMLELDCWLPVIAVWATLPEVFSARRARPSEDAEPYDSLAAFYFYAVVSLLVLYPAADVCHVIMNIPVFLVLLSRQLYLVYQVELGSDNRRSQRAPRRRGRAVAMCALLVVSAAPYVLELVTAWSGRSAGTSRFSRASWIFDSRSKFGEAAALAEYLDAMPRQHRPILILANEQLLYFLAGKRSTAEYQEFIFYLIGLGFISDANARKQIDQPALLRGLDAEKPLVIDYGESLSGTRLRRALPALREYLDREYRPSARFGEYRVFDRARD